MKMMRAIAALGLAACLTVGGTGLSLAELATAAPTEAPRKVLDLDQKVPGSKSIEANWRTVSGEKALTDETVLSYGTAQTKLLQYSSSARTWTPTDKDATPSKFDWTYYEDDTITVRTEYATVQPAYKNKAVPCSITYVKVADASQVRSAMSNDDYNKRAYVSAESMAAHVNAVVAVNGDYFKYHYKVGYVVRQGVEYRDSLNGKRDLLLIDEKGDFHWVEAATSASTKDYIAQSGIRVINSFTLGPVLVADGEARVIKETIVASSGEFQWCYPQQRVAVLQTGDLEYAVVETYGKTDSSQGLTLQEFADLIAYLFPDCRLAYNLDGGGSTNVVVNGARVHTTPGHREISDILYFASAWDK